MSPGGPEPYREYRAIRRIQKACTNCRRKKARCSGERPVCGYCKRLSQECRWDDAGGGAEKLTTLDGHDPSNASDDRMPRGGDDVLSIRVTAIEAKLDNLTTTLNTVLPILVGQQNAESPHSSPLPDLSNLTPISSLAKNQTSGDEQTASNTDRSSMCVDAREYHTLPPPHIVSSLVDVYFARVQNQPYSFFHEGNFRQRLQYGLLPDHLKFAVLAAAVRFSDDPYYRDAKHKAAAMYASESWKLLISSWFATESDPNIHICQTVTILSIIDYTAGRRHPAWLKIGMAIRVAQDLCFMMEPDPSMQYADQEERRRVFWSIYILDKLCSCSRARPSAIADAHCRVQLPCDELTFRNGEWKKMPTLAQLLSSQVSVVEHPGSLSLVVLTASILGKCAQNCIHESNRTDSRLPPWDSKSDFATIYAALLQIETQFDMSRCISEALRDDCTKDGIIDMQLAGPLIFYRILFQVCHCLLCHPFLLYQQLRTKYPKPPPSFLNRTLQTSREHALATSRLIRDVRGMGCGIFYSFIGYCTTIASGVHALFMNDSDLTVSREARDCLQLDASFLEEFSEYWKCGIEMTAIIRNLTQRSLPSSLLFAGSSSTDSMSADMMESLWASVDYNNMTQAMNLTRNSPATFQPTAPPSNDVFHTAPADQTAFDPHANASSQAIQFNNQSPNPSFSFGGLSPFTSYFGGASMDFGA